MAAETSHSRRISDALDRLESAVTKHPSLGRDTGRSISTITDGLRCTSEEGAFRFETDLPDTMGGNGSGPAPGVLGRAALGSCLAMGYQMRAARLGVDMNSLSVEIEADFDAIGMLSIGSTARPGYSEVRCHVTVVSSAPEADILRVLDEGDLLSPYRDVFSAPTPITRTVSIELPTA
ncbi:MAG TPA: OsmC family protein [Ilumatobacteraceae bacterium]|nr:OsmC family protein [Ilumatobacteraceae bacterium]